MRMPGPDYKPRSGALRTRLVVVLLALMSVLIVGLVWQALQTAGSNRATATRVLQDYGRLAGDEFIRRAMVDVGYNGYFGHINALRRQLAAGTDILSQPPGAGISDEAAVAARLALWRFIVDGVTPGGRFSSPVESDVKAYVAERATAVAAMSPDTTPLVIDHKRFDNLSRTFVFASAGDAVIGFEVDRAMLALRLRKLLGGEPLLPDSLARGAVGNESLYLEFKDDSGDVLFSTTGSYDPYLLTTKVIDDEYSGIFLSHAVSVAIDASAAEALIIGGLPRSRVPLLLVTVVLTVALLIAAILQLRREYALMKMRSDFVSEVSHELRTPLAQIRMFIETLLLERFESADDKRRALEIINRESQRLIHLVDNVLRFSGENGKAPSLNVSGGPLAPTVTRVVDEFRLLADAAGSSIDVELDAEAEAAFDEDALRRILLNLLDNAVKYGPAGQRILVTVQAAAGGARLSVHDQGPGVPAAEREKIWDGYYRLDRERDSAIAGTGIGLAVVQDLVRRLDGKAWVESHDHAGSAFIVELPRAATQS